MDSSPIVRVAAQVAPDAGQEQAGDGLLGLHPHREAARSRCVRSAPISRSASSGDKILGRVRGTRTSGAIRDRIVPPWRRVISPRGTGLARTGVSPRATR